MTVFAKGSSGIADYLKQSAGIRFTFGLVELAIFDMPDGSDGGVIVEPRVLARTFEIERAVVRLADAGMVVEDPSTSSKTQITKAGFYAQIERIDPALPASLERISSSVTPPWARPRTRG